MQMSVRSSDEKCSRAHKIHLSLSGLSLDSLRSVSGQSQVSLRSVSGQSGQSQVSLRTISVESQLRSGLSLLTSSDRRSLKYFVLFTFKYKFPMLYLFNIKDVLATSSGLFDGMT